MMQHLNDVLALGEQHAEDVKLPKKRLSDNEVENVAEECFWNAVIPLLEERGADLEARIKGATLEDHYTRAFVAAYRARESPRAKPAKATSKKKPAKQAKPAAPIRGLGKAGDPKGETLAAVKAYVESGADVDALLDEGDVLVESMLHLAAENHHVAIMKYLLDHGADPNLENGHCDSCPLLKVIGHRDDNPAAVALLLDHGADPNRAEHNCELPLNDAVIMGHAKTVELLLARGANPSRKTGRSKSKTAFEWAEEMRRPKISALLATSSSSRAPSRAPRVGGLADPREDALRLCALLEQLGSSQHNVACVAAAGTARVCSVGHGDEQLLRPPTRRAISRSRSIRRSTSIRGMAPWSDHAPVGPVSR